MKSNVSVPSNVYLITSSAALVDHRFLRQVRGYAAVSKIADYISMGKLTDIQKLTLRIRNVCGLNKQSVVFGIVKENENFLEKCRCEKKDCTNLATCLKYDHFEFLSEEHWSNSGGVSTNTIIEDELEKTVGKLYDKLLGGYNEKKCKSS
jgi:hypothetical protein